MPNVAKVLKEEIVRLARRESKSALSKLRTDTVMLKRRAADYKRRISALERELKKFGRLAKDKLVASATPSERELSGARISSGMVKRVRTKLGLSQAELAKLLDASPMSVYMWERKGGRLNLRSAMRSAFLAIRKLGKREAQARLAGPTGAAKPANGRKTRKASKKSSAPQRRAVRRKRK